MSFHGFLTVQSRGTVALPPELRRKYHLDQPGAQVEVTERADGVIEVRPAIAVPASQAWFWTEDRQRRERQADTDIAAGQVTDHDGVEDLLAHLDGLEDEAVQEEATQPDDRAVGTPATVLPAAAAPGQG